jgi:hypothetical protein
MRPTGASAGLGTDRVHRKSLDLELALKPPQNVTDVITIVTSSQASTGDRDTSTHR